MESIWRKTMEFPEFPSLEGNARTQVLVVGAASGVLCCYFLTRAGIDCMLLEADQICGGTTQNTTAKITAQHGLIYHRLLKSKGKEAAGLYLAANQATLEQYRRLAGRWTATLRRRTPLSTPERAGNCWRRRLPP